MLIFNKNKHKTLVIFKFEKNRHIQTKDMQCHSPIISHISLFLFIFCSIFIKDLINKIGSSQFTKIFMK